MGVAEAVRTRPVERQADRDDTLCHIGDSRRDNRYGICGAKIKGVPAAPPVERRRCKVCADLAGLKV